MNKVLKVPDMQKYETQMLIEIDRICKKHNIPYYLNCGSVLGAIRHQGPIPWDSDMDIVVPYPYLKNFYDMMRIELDKKYRFHTYDVDKRYHRFMPRIGLAGNDTLILHVDVFALVGLPSDLCAQKRFARKSKFLNKVFIIKTTPITTKRNSVIKSLLAVIIKILLLPFSRDILWKMFLKHCEKYPYEQAEYVMNPCGGYGLKNILKKEVFGTPLYVDYDGIKAPIPEHYEYYLKHYYKDYLKFPPEEEREREASRIIEINI